MENGSNGSCGLGNGVSTRADFRSIEELATCVNRGCALHAFQQLFIREPQLTGFLDMTGCAGFAGIDVADCDVDQFHERLAQ